MSDSKVLFGAGAVPAGYREHLEPVIFGPWAARLTDFVGIAAGDRVLDVASGTGVVARIAAQRAGIDGRVIASDISAAMLAYVQEGLQPGSAPVETLECSATSLALDDGAVDVVLCQHGLPFIPDREAAAREMRRVLRAGGRAGVAVWLSNPWLAPFATYGQDLRDHGLSEPFPNVYDSTAHSMSISDVESAFVAAKFLDTHVLTQDFALNWASPAAAARAVFGTPYGPVVTGLDPPAQREVMNDIERRMTADDGTAVRHVTTAVLGRGTAG